MGVDIANGHHEKWNGSGYPGGLSGQGIPLPARIMAVADVYDALCSKRCYKEPMPHDEACCTIRDDAGKSFDPALVEAFCELRDEFRETRERMGN
mgnify:CR=1 FL=1